MHEDVPKIPRIGLARTGKKEVFL